MATTTQEAPSTEPANPLTESLTKVTGINPLSTSTGTASPISYDSDLAFRSPQGDIIQISGDPGSGATTAETWSHELALEQLKNQQLEFEYKQQQDLIEQAYQQQQYGLSAASGALASKSQAAQEAQFRQNYALQQAEAQRAAALAPYQVQSASLANQQAQYDLNAKARAEQKALEAQAMYEGIAKQFAWQGNYPITPESSTAYMAQATGQAKPTTTYQPQLGTADYLNYGRTPIYSTGQPTYTNSLTGKGIYG